MLRLLMDAFQLCSLGNSPPWPKPLLEPKLRLLSLGSKADCFCGVLSTGGPFSDLVKTAHRVQARASLLAQSRYTPQALSTTSRPAMKTLRSDTGSWPSPEDSQRFPINSICTNGSSDMSAMAERFEEYRIDHGPGDPDGKRHRKDDPATIAEMRKGHSA